MSIELYNSTSFKISNLIAKNYSTSFGFAMNLFNSELKDSIAAIYGYVRLADEIVDTFHDQDKKYLLDELRKDTFTALQNGISINPVLNSFQFTVNRYMIPHVYITEFLDSMEMDISYSYYDRSKYDKYIHGSAEVVGLMCLKIFCHNNNTLFESLEIPAKSLGSAFQKVNFLRDIKSDLSERGRIYIPGADNEKELNDENKIFLETEVENEFKAALSGIKKLPKNSMLGVYTAYMYYNILLKKIKKMNMDDLKSGRVRISNFTKFILLVKSAVKVRTLNAA
ncbi:MAG: phytoene/squalene synthase family protein [Ignavibacteria bacterium]|nr:phytoene/squalene synthase family protein [Ignavibacteria bacterium]MBK9406301.1 phytoene/squalene synthase family protein [Ignavibacteria bacterium]MBL0106176.1 phytoene/squalene synthase family protein [Ignavibacteria bacterium]